MHLFNHQKIQWPEWEMRTKLAEDEFTFVDAQMVLEQHTEAYEAMIRAVKSEPVELAACLYKVRKHVAKVNVPLSTLSGDGFRPAV